ncbi:uncharacterized protein LOC119721793 [Patiria miniata]|uniref:Uncharacterized protein n=1 Tax=Patiria miniata TaxID=46514 RepID=A0A913Z798_PATMI|nr:uncharacterized protein LOC119721793 [Patiria miniata]
MEHREDTGDKTPRVTTAPQATSRKGSGVKKATSKATSGPKGKTQKGTNSRSITPPVSGPSASPSNPASISRGFAGISSPRPPGLLAPATLGDDQSRSGKRIQSSPAPSARSSRSEHPASTRAEWAGLAVTDLPPPPIRATDSQSTSFFDQCSGIPRILSEFSSSESSHPSKKRKHKAAPSFSGDSPRKSTHRKKKNKGVSTEIFLKAFQDINVSLAALNKQQQWRSAPMVTQRSLPAATFPDPNPGLILPDPGVIRPDPGPIRPNPGAIRPDPGLIQPDPGAILPISGGMREEPLTLAIFCHLRLS